MAAKSKIKAKNFRQKKEFEIRYEDKSAGQQLALIFEEIKNCYCLMRRA